MAYVAISLFLALGAWLALAARTGPSRRLETALPLTDQLRVDAVRSPDRDARAVAGGRDHLADDRRARHLTDDEQSTRGLRVRQQDQGELVRRSPPSGADAPSRGCGVSLRGRTRR